jgi:tRNA threonylcarbamoyladenosine modification (KEOPS) complex  Pcc1 subunit
MRSVAVTISAGVLAGMRARAENALRWLRAAVVTGALLGDE